MKKLILLVLVFLHTYANDAFIKKNELREIIYDKNLVIIDVSESYKKSHISGAVSFNVSKILELDGSYFTKVSLSRIESYMSDLGIDNDSKVVIYGRNTDADIKNSSYLAYILISNGFQNVSLLDGGYMSWVFEYDLLVNKVDSEADDEGNIKLIPQNISVDAKYIKDNIPNLTLIDAREAPYYFGTKMVKNINMQGHIPNAKSSSYKDKFLRDGTIRPDDELEDIYLNGLELNKDDEIVVYGESVYDAVVEWYIIYQKMGFKNAKLYEKSLLEYDALKYKSIRFKWE